MDMDVFSNVISRKFRNIAGKRYDEIMRFYREFLLSEEEMRVPMVSRFLMPLDRSTLDIPDPVYDILSAYKGVPVLLLYVIDVEVLRIVEGTLGKEEADTFKERELKAARELLDSIEDRLSSFRIRWDEDVVLGHKCEDVIDRVRHSDMLVLSKRYGSEGAKSSRISPLVFRIVHSVSEPVVVY